MSARWISESPAAGPGIVGQARVASWWPGKYYFVSTISLLNEANDPFLLKVQQLSDQLRAISGERPSKDAYITQIFRCDRYGNPTSSFDHPIYERTYSDLFAAQQGHKDTIELVRRGKYHGEYRWTRWAAPGGSGYGMTHWGALAAGLLASFWAFHLVPQWWLGVPAAVVGWLVGTALAGALWALVRRLIEWFEGIR